MYKNNKKHGLLKGFLKTKVAIAFVTSLIYANKKFSFLNLQNNYILRMRSDSRTPYVQKLLIRS